MNETQQRELNEQLFAAAMQGNVKQIEKLIEAGAKVDAVNRDGETPLHYAAINSRKETIEFLLEKGANINPNLYGGTTFHYITIYDQKKMVEFLLEKGANINAVDQN